MKIALVYHEVPLSIKIANQFLNLCQTNELIYDDTSPDVVISIGGDGTMLSAFHRYSDQLNKIRFAGIHTGHLGFYTDWLKDEVDLLMHSLLNDSGQEVSYPLLEVKVQRKDHLNNDVRLLALNEATIKKMMGTFICDVQINGELFEVFRGDGLCVSTPTGSTGANKSFGGAILHPSHNAIQLAEIASLNNRVFRTLGSPLILGDNDELTVYIQETDQLILTYDHLGEDASMIEKLTFQVAKERIRFLSDRHMPFWKRVKNAFIEADEEDSNGL
ncbi:NAD kinase [Atopobacter phocae]|uniref:NAD kinase n=1 Tax=Atopobacter phocae TaxID=136492 RepID=UPI0004725585|nr:NAD kinase [Atopobacter phocae]